ncbi:hypothetical protein KSS87_012692 [Heliosperma pusillum]|nr:hypothetical protein KSS87_012692 [Heliosperma pusillum]
MTRSEKRKKKKKDTTTTTTTHLRLQPPTLNNQPHPTPRLPAPSSDHDNQQRCGWRRWRLRRRRKGGASEERGEAAEKEEERRGVGGERRGDSGQWRRRPRRVVVVLVEVVVVFIKFTFFFRSTFFYSDGGGRWSWGCVWSTVLVGRLVAVIVIVDGRLVVVGVGDGCLSYTFADENSIKLVSEDAQHNFLDDLPFHRYVKVNAIYQFGDSFSDTGNVMLVDPSNKCNKLPYGQAYFDKPTGRCSNGLLLIDSYAKLLDMSLIDAYLNKDGNYTQGVNFAVVGATALDASFLEKSFNISLTSNFSLSLQLTWFKSHLHSFYPNVSERRRNLAKSLVLMGEVGSNDYNYAFFLRKPLSILYNMVPYVIQAIRTTVEEIIDLGATHIAIPGNFPIGCLPIYLRLFKTNDLNMYDEVKCLKKYNTHSKYHNDQLQKTIIELQKKYPNVAIVYLDYFGAFKEIFQHASLFGFDESAKQTACCGGGDNEYNVDIKLTCGSEGTVVCKNQQSHISWDGVHLTQSTHQVMAKLLLPSLLRAYQNVA